MRRTIIVLLMSILPAWLVFGGEEGNEPRPKQDDPRPKADEGRGRARWFRQPGEGGAEEGRAGQPRMGFNPMGMLGMPGGGNVTEMASRMLGIDLEQSKRKPLQALPVGANRRLIFNVPVGGVDSPGGTGAGWKMESLFKVNEEQQRTLDELRQEYDTERLKFELEVAAQQKVLAEKLLALRLKYEQRATELLAGADKDSKTQLDALARDSAAKTNEVVAEAMKLYDPEDMTQGLALVRALREKTTDLVNEAELKLVKLVPAGAREKIEEVIRNNAAAREMVNRLLQGFGRARGGPEGRPGEGPRPPEGERPAPPPGEGGF